MILPLLAPVPSLLHVINYNLICPINTKTLPDGAPCHHRPGAVCHAAGLHARGSVCCAPRSSDESTDLAVFDRIVANSAVGGRAATRRKDVRVDGWILNGVAPRRAASSARRGTGRWIRWTAGQEERRRRPAARLGDVGSSSAGSAARRRRGRSRAAGARAPGARPRRRSIGRLHRPPRLGGARARPRAGLGAGGPFDLGRTVRSGRGGSDDARHRGGGDRRQRPRGAGGRG